MNLHGKKVIYGKELFPYNEQILDSNIRDRLYFLFPTKYLSAKPRVLGDYKEDTSYGYLYMTGITFFAEAIKNALSYRGKHRGKTHDDNKNPRVQIVMSYIPKQVYRNENTKEMIINDFELFDESNIIAYLFTIWVFDSDIDLGDAISDQLEINQYGSPKLKQDKELEKYLASIGFTSSDNEIVDEGPPSDIRSNETRIPPPPPPRIEPRLDQKG